eukprot:TRINITY_DN13207_c0_g2_i4.p2 TRINITY_DN13207_c0_g2~~TRINITY_DN13207_c0_g2_i4.p2  ORF type:complete len:105 (-),score=5.70 TRINITY_DN13207_c0_g2_i4:29-343(-)
MGSPPVQACGTPSVELSAAHIAIVNTEGQHRFDWLIQRPDDGAALAVEVSASIVDLDGESVILALSLIHISEPTRLGMISYAVFCLKKKKTSTRRSTKCAATSP